MSLGPPVDLAALDRVLEAAAGAGEFSGAVRITLGGRPVYEAVTGMANRADEVPITPRTRFGIASVTKMFTATAVARLVDLGRLGFDAPLVGCLPPAQVPDACGPEVTLHHLLTHTSGLRDYHAEAVPGSAAPYGDLWERTSNYALRRPADYLPLFTHLEARAAPGPPPSYSDAGFILLGLVLEHATGLTYAEVIRREVFEPAGMADCDLFALDEVHPRVATGYLPPSPGNPNWTSNIYSLPAASSPDGGAFATAADLCRFLDALHGGELVGPATAGRMLRAHAGDPGHGFDYGYGVILTERAGLRLTGHSGEDAGVAARVFRADDHDLDVVVLANLSGAAGPVWRQAVRLLGAALAPGARRSQAGSG